MTKNTLLCVCGVWCVVWVCLHTRETSSHSRSPSPVVGKVEYITEFGMEEPPPPPVPIPPAPQSSNKPLQSRGLEKKLSPQGGRRRKLESPHSSGSSHNARSKRSRSPDRRRRRSSSWRRSERSRTRSRSRERRRRLADGVCGCV